MASDESSSDSRTIEPSQKRLEDARAKGDVAKSTDLLTAAAYGGWILAFALGGGLVLQAGAIGREMIAQSSQVAELAAEGARSALAGLVGQMVTGVLALSLVPAALVLLSLFAQQALVFAPDKLAPKLSRLSPIANAKHKFGMEGLFEFAKSAIKMALIALALGYFLISNQSLILESVAVDPRISLGQSAVLVGQFLGIATAISIGIGAVDFLWQKRALLRRNRMTWQEAKEDIKENDGDPYAKAERRRRGQELAMNQMLGAVDEANVVIVNPTHFAVALKWSKGARTAPVLVAKGVDEIARAIRERAALAGVPIHSDPPTARAIHATVEIGQPIERAHYKAVAAAIRFAEAMRRRAKGAIK